MINPTHLLILALPFFTLTNSLPLPHKPHHISTTGPTEATEAWNASGVLPAPPVRQKEGPIFTATSTITVPCDQATPTPEPAPVVVVPPTPTGAPGAGQSGTPDAEEEPCEEEDPAVPAEGEEPCNDDGPETAPPEVVLPLPSNPTPAPAPVPAQPGTILPLPAPPVEGAPVADKPCKDGETTPAPVDVPVGVSPTPTTPTTPTPDAPAEEEEEDCEEEDDDTPVAAPAPVVDAPAPDTEETPTDPGYPAPNPLCKKRISVSEPTTCLAFSTAYNLTPAKFIELNPEVHDIYHQMYTAIKTAEDAVRIKEGEALHMEDDGAGTECEGVEVVVGGEYCVE